MNTSDTRINSMIPILTALAGIGMPWTQPAQAQCVEIGYRNRDEFTESALGGPVLNESFDSFPSGSAVSSLFGGQVTFGAPLATVFYGGWGPGEFSGGALLPPRGGVLRQGSVPVPAF